MGDDVHVRDESFAGHTRCPRDVRHRRGTIVRIDDPAPVPEIEAHRRERVLESVYCVRFSGEELWPGSAEPATTVHVDLYERYLEPV